MGRNKKKTNLTHFKLCYYYYLLVIIVVIIIVLVIIIAVVIVVVVIVVIIIVVVFLLLLFTVYYDSKGENGKHITIATAIEIVVSVSTPQLCGSFLLQ